MKLLWISTASALKIQKLIHTEIKSRLDSCNACYHSIQNLLSSRLVPKLKYQNIQNYNFAVALYGCETWSLALGEEYRLAIFENRILRRTYGQKRD
jgi:hypothetical protein